MSFNEFNNVNILLNNCLLPLEGNEKINMPLKAKRHWRESLWYMLKYHFLLLQKYVCSTLGPMGLRIVRALHLKPKALHRLLERLICCVFEFVPSEPHLALSLPWVPPRCSLPFPAALPSCPVWAEAVGAWVPLHLRYGLGLWVWTGGSQRIT